MKKILISAFILATTLTMISCSTKINIVKGDDSGMSIISDSTTIANTKYGKVQGYRDGDIYTFKGIQYAKADRFMPPEFPDTFEGVKICRTYGPKTPQSSNLMWKADESDYKFGFQFNLEPEDEKNCLVLNVWTKGLKDGKKRPVFVWIHGGGFAAGSGNDLPCYEGRSLAEKGDIVVVNMNHRLNILGFLDLRALGGKYSKSVNMGMQDLVKSLEWIRDNIENFGGDASNITIAGQSGGGGKVNTLLAMPSAQNLFHKAITQSGSWILHNQDEVSKEFGLKVVEELGIKPSEADKLNDFSYDELIGAGNRAIESMNKILLKRGDNPSVSFCPTVDGKYVTNPSFDPDAPEISKKIPMIIGSNKNEFTYDNSKKKTLKEVKQILEKNIGNKTNDFIKAYDNVYPGHTTEEMIYTDLFLRSAAIRHANAKSKQGTANVYMYLFTWKPTGNALGACHGMELPFVFNNVDLQREMTGASKDAYELQDLISSSWIQFIKTGDPNVNGLPKWQPYTKENGNTMVFDNDCKIVHNHDSEIIQFDMPRHIF